MLSELILTACYHNKFLGGHMNARRILSVAFCLATSLLATSLLTTPAAATHPFTMVESGFDVTDLGDSSGPKGAVCSPGGVWGNYVYVGESNGNAIERIDFADNVSFFAGGAPDIAFPVGMVFGPGPASTFGTFLYVASYGSGRITRVDPSGIPSLFVNFPSVSDVTFDPTGSYGNDLFAIEYFGGISTVDQFGAIAPFSPGVTSSYFRFGPGGAWGTGLYATSNDVSPGIGIITVDIAGTPALFSGGMNIPEQFDWAFGGGFGGDMFVANFGNAEILRVKPDGTYTVFANTARPAGIVFCNDCLYVTSFEGGCWKICNSPTPVENTSWGTIKGAYGSVDNAQPE